MASSDNDLYILKGSMPQPILQPHSNQQLASQSRFEQQSAQDQRSTGIAEPMASMDIFQTDDQRLTEMTRKTTATAPREENPLNYVAALRLRQEQGRRSSNNLFELF